MSDRTDPEDDEESTDGEQSVDDPGDVPLSGLRENIEERRVRRQQRAPEPDAAFEEAVSEPLLDGEQVWEDLVSSDSEDIGQVALGDDVDELLDTAMADLDEDVAIIKDSVCHNCKYFGEPPELHCAHDGTTIRRMVDMQRFEVVNCPVVKSRSDLRQQ